MKNTSYSTQLSVLEVSIVGTNMTKQTIQSNTEGHSHKTGSIRSAVAPHTR